MKINRQEVYVKCGGRCGYCGSIIAMKDMQVDHMTPRCNGGTNDLLNLLPTCRQCNHYKRGSNVEWFRRSMLTLHERVEKIYIWRVANNFSMTGIEPFNGTFYFERLKPTT